MASYSNTNYSNDYFDTTGYFNSTSQTSSNIDVDELDKRYLQKSGGTISNNLLVSGSVDIQTSLTIPNIGNVENAIGTKQDTIEDGDLTDGLATALSGKQPTIDTDTDLSAKSLSVTGRVTTTELYVGFNNFVTIVEGKQPTINTGDLAITDTAGLVTALAGKEDEITTDDLAITDTAGLFTALAGKQPSINTDDLAITDTAGLETALSGKQATIDGTSDLTSNSLITNDLEVNGGVDIDTGEYFDTIVIRRLSGATDTINLNELQVWVNGSNLLVENSATLTSYFADWSVDKNEDLGSYQGSVASRIYNNVIEGGIGAHSDGGNSLIIKNIPSTDINKIQALVLYNRDQHSYTQVRAI